MWKIFVLYLLVFGIVSVVVIQKYMEWYRSYKKYSKEIVNHDSLMREFHYQVDKSEYEIWELLSHHNGYDKMKYHTDEIKKRITFYSELPTGYLDTTYTVSVSKNEGYTLLKIIQIDNLWQNNQYAWFQNEFWKQKIGAVPVSYKQGR